MESLNVASAGAILMLALRNSAYELRYLTAWKKSSTQEENGKRCRKERQVATSTDRSKFKKTDQNLHKKKVPSLENLKRGQVIAILSEGILVDSDGKQILCSLKGTLKQENSLVKNLVAVGDFVHFSEAGALPMWKRGVRSFPAQTTSQEKSNSSSPSILTRS